MAGKEKSGKGKRISVWNWMGTLILCSIPLVNIITLILTIILAKTRSKRNFAIAALILMVLGAVLICAAFIVFGAELSTLADELRMESSVVLPTIPQI